MTDFEPTQGRQTARHFRRLYLVALSLIAALAIGGQLLVQRSLESQRGDSHVVNQAGYQRMLSQRITLKALLYPGGDQASAQLHELVAMRDRWLASHFELAGAVSRIAYGDAARASLNNLFQEVDQPLRRIAALVTRLADESPLTAAERSALLADQEIFLPLMDSVVLGFDLSVQARIAFLQRIELTLLAVTLVVLGLEAVLIFRPAVNRLQVSLDELERRNAQATRRLESLRHLAGGIAHSFNNLLTGIMGHADLERLDALHAGRSTEYIDAQLGSCKRAAEIVTHLVRYSGHGHYDCEVTLLGPWLGEVARAFAGKGSAVKIEVQVKEDAKALVDRNALGQAIDGILANAVEAMHGRTTPVILRLSPHLLTTPKMTAGPYRSELAPGLYACIQVIDQGDGIPPENLDRVFDPYFSSKEFGRGLGLAAVLGIAHGHGGGIRVESETGRGSTVSLFVPVVTSGTKVPFAASHPARPGRAE